MERGAVAPRCGNRKTRSFSGTPQAITIAATSNRSLSLAGPPLVTYAYDASGNRTGDDIASYGYDARGRMSQATTAAGTTAYRYNALNQRIRKTGPLGDTLFLHDLAGHLIAEANASGAITREYVWLDDTPVAILDGPVGNTQIHAIHPDQLDTPRAVTDSTGKVVWRNSPVGEPFGLTSPEEDPDHDGTAFVMNLRFPGQYFDRETNLAQNWHRSYDAGGGFYTTSDPIGLAGGQWSTYGYVNGQPTGYTDPLGLYPGEEYVDATRDFWRNYRDMRDANTIGADKYFHCKANCEAAQRGKKGEQMACLISDGREWFDQNIKGDPASASAADQAANHYGRSQGAASSQACSQLCAPYRPNGLPARY